MDQVSDGKYVVIKTDDYNTWIQVGEWKPPTMVTDAVVIRLQDQFAASALTAYASSILTALEIMDDFGYPSAHARKHLTQVADFFFSKAEEARNWPGRKLPD
jgi:hypothetical protein